MISLTIRMTYFDKPPNLFPQMMQSLLFRSESLLKTLILDLGNSSPQFLYDITSGFFDCLEAVSITSNTCNPIRAIPTHTKVTVFEGASKLREFTLTSPSLVGARHHFCPTVFLLPWPQLITLHLGPMFPLWPAEAHMMLCQCSSLVSCEISIATDGDRSRVVRQSSPTIMPNLGRLRLFLRDDSNPCLQDFGFPGLIALELDSVAGYYNSISWDEDLHPFIRNLCTLESLVVKPDMTPPMVEKLLQNSPMLTSLALHGSTPLDGGTLVMIANGSLLPRLNHLICKVGRLSQALDMVESRLNDTHLTTIREVMISHPTPCVENDTERVAMLENGGLSVSINCTFTSSRRRLSKFLRR
jgi:hypothetical protein